MSRHEGVSCDSCLKGNFRGKRYKCLVCYDYDLCATCYEAGASTTRHNADHPMQCILTRSDFDLYYGGEAVSVEHPQSFTCPFCGKMGFTEATLTDHVAGEHSDSSVEIVCPICASQPGGEPNHMTDDFSAHLALDHRNRDIEEPSSSRHIRRIPHGGRGMSSTRPRRSQMQFTSASGFSSLSPNSRDSMDPIAELLSQLSSVRRSNLAQSSTTSQLQQLQMQLQMERQQAQVARQQLERMPRRQATTTNASGSNAASTLQSNYTVSVESSSSPLSSSFGPQFLLSRCTDSVSTETELQALDIEKADRSMFVQELLLNTLNEDFHSEDWNDLFSALDLSPDSSCNSAAVKPSLNLDQSLKQSHESAIIKAECSSSCTQPRSNETDFQQTWNVSVASDIIVQPFAVDRAFNRESTNSTAFNNRINSSHANFQEGVIGSSRHLERTGARERSSLNRRKIIHQVDDRNKTTEPPPPH